MYDVVIIGGGPAGLTAAIYASRSRMKILLIESFTTPGQAVITSDVENYPGFPEGLNGFELIERFKKQAEKFGTEFKVGEVKNIKEGKSGANKTWKIELDNKEIIESLSVIIASGATPRKLDIPCEREFCGKGVSYCATCDGAFFKDKNVVVIGGGDTAIEEALFLTRFASKVTIIHRRVSLRATKILQERAFANKKIEFVWSSTVTDIIGDKKVSAVKIENVENKEKKEIPCDGVFVFIGYDPNTAFVKGLVELDKDGHIISDENMKTSKAGIFVCGDARKKILRQIVTACGDGAVAAVSARIYVDELKGIAYK